MKVVLQKIATVQMGYSFRTRLEPVAEGEVAVIQMKDLLQDNTINCLSLTRVDIAAVKEHHLVRRGDLVFRSRGQITTSAILLDAFPAMTVVAAPLLRIRVTEPEKVLPEYLNWYISQSQAQRHFTSRQEGTSVNMLNRRQLELLPVDLPSPQRQKDIVDLASLASREQDLLHSLAGKRKQFISSQLMCLAKGTTDEHR